MKKFLPIFFLTFLLASINCKIDASSSSQCTAPKPPNEDEILDEKEFRSVINDVAKENEKDEKSTCSSCSLGSDLNMPEGFGAEQLNLIMSQLLDTLEVVIKGHLDKATAAGGVCHKLKDVEIFFPKKPKEVLETIEEQELAIKTLADITEARKNLTSFTPETMENIL